MRIIRALPLVSAVVAMATLAASPAAASKNCIPEQKAEAAQLASAC